MKKYLKNIIEKYENILKKEKINKNECDELFRQISFMQHERLIHFLVTMLFVIVFFIVFSGIVCFGKIILIPVAVLVLALIIPYIAHYYFLENGVQKLYEIYSEMKEKSENNDE